MDALDLLHREILGCTRCQDAGHIGRAAPVVAGRADNRVMLIGQAPGVTEMDVRRPFSGRAGRELFRWLASVGIAEDEFRQHAYMTAVTKCYPGRVPCGSGDRRPSSKEIALCRPFLDHQLRLVRPEIIVLVGSLAIERFFPRQPLSALIGQRLVQDTVVFVPLPHPSGASRWLNVAEHRSLLAQALQHLRAEWDRVVLGTAARAVAP